MTGRGSGSRTPAASDASGCWRTGRRTTARASASWARSPFTAEYLENRIGNSRRAVKECLLDQGVVAGIGNIYSDEILFDTNIDPMCPACLLGHEDWERLAEEIPRALRFFIEKNEISPEEWLEGKGKEYRNTPYIRIYGHAGQPCPVCGTPLVRRVIGGRSSVSCPMCQRSRGC